MKKTYKIILLILVITSTMIANQKQTLTVYTYDSFAASWGPAPKIKEAFEKKYNCNLKFVATSSAIGAFRKIQLEGKNTKADVLLGLDTSMMETAKHSSLFESHNINTNVINTLSVKWKDKVFLPYDYSYFAFVYDSDKLKTPPTSFEELSAMPKDFKIVIQDPRSSTPGLGLILWIKKVYKDRAFEYWEKLSPHILTVTKGWSEAYGLFLKGEANMVLSYVTSPAYHIIAEKKYNYKYASFKEGHYGQIEVAAMLKSSKNKDLAKKFLKFVLSDEFANIIPTTNWTYPIIKSKNDLPKVFEELKPDSKMLLIDEKVLFEKRKEYIQEWLEATR